MNHMVKKIVPLSLLLLAGCFDSRCSENNKNCPSTSKPAQVATPKQRCSHPGCNHDHSKKYAPIADKEILSDAKVVVEKPTEMVIEDHIDAHNK